MSWEQRNADFCKAQTDAQMAYIEAEREVDKLKTENAKLREQLDTAEHNRVRNAREYARLCHENDRLRALVKVAWLSPSREMGAEADA